MVLFNIIFILLVGYSAIGLFFAIRHITELKDMIEKCQSKEKFYRDMIEMYGTSSTGAEYYVALQDLIIQKKEVFDEAESKKENEWRWYVEMAIPFIIAWPHLYSIESKIKSRV